ncbi:uncharacterized protein L969DRAFT_47873 [Mixia osmundae IAM 14324]|uniref:Phosphatidylglycerol/phosphatidylinositol transfer protein n=1 Tax=Mixia osmundae (strain CBS 9802 / IAM 14324 / JCM 22182 / KY 12970) TaxID=764103 RepID=G7E9Q7_MIXOS|nr:uncharacterized protein L969DRAFT_47873 [Mixia osmundae IAM 14324]KEI40007.1 hypothetical protein L969DRAFT_47873 [Mixia osmundae IAM 14324]GAA99376.1 hypothetical protein E5Q_06072 [Mixia osmundae IAM 14324]
MRGSALLFGAVLLPLVASAPAQLPIGSLVDYAADSLSHLGSQGDVRTNTIWSFIDCGTEKDAVELESLAVSPDPPQAGKNLTVTATGTVKTMIDEGAYADVLVKLGYIKLLTKRFDVCEELDKANATLQCPVEEGRYTIVQTVELPREIPKAKFIVQVRAFTQDDAPMACADIMIDFLRS